MPFPASIDLDEIAAGTGGFKIQGQNAGDLAGGSVSAAGDVNGDGIADLVVGARSNGSGGSLAGAAYVVFGTTDGFATPVDLDTIALGTGGFKVQGQNAYDIAGVAVSAAGDVNGDGIDDLIVGAYRNGSGGSLAGAAYVVFGTTDGFATPVDLNTVAAGTGGFKIQGQNAVDGAGASVSAAGDVNGDGIADLVVGAYHNDSGGSQAGAAYVVFGTTGGFASPVDLDTIALGTGGFKVQGQNAYDIAGGSVSAAGDVNGDGIDDLIVGAYRNGSGGSLAGAAYVVFGTTGGFATPVDLDTVAAGTGGFKIQGQNADDLAGFSVSAAGDVNGDGIADLIVGAIGDDSGGLVAGAAYVVFGTTGGFATPVDLDTVAAGTGGFKIQGQNVGDDTGWSVSAAGDVNGDGIADLIVGAVGDDSGGSLAGAAYVVFGTTGGFATPVDLDTVAAGTGGFKIQGQNADDLAGWSVSAAGDVNGDGVDDLIVGAFRNDSGGSDAGAAYVIYGQRAALFSDGDDVRDLNGFDLTHFTTAQATHALSGNDTVTLSETQDLGLLFFGNVGNDRITGSSHADRVEGDGGGDTVLGGNGGDTLWGKDDADSVSGDRGNDIVYGGGGGDTVWGKDDADQVYGDAGNDTVFGGNGSDSVFGGTDNDTVFGDAGNDTLYGGDGADSVAGGAGNDRIFGGFGLDHLTGNGGADRFVFGQVSDSQSNAPDTITDFTHGQDKVDLSALGPLTFIGSDPFSAADQVREIVSAGHTLLQVNTIGTSGPEMAIAFSSAVTVTEGDLLL